MYSGFFAGADPGFSVGGGVNPPEGEGHKHRILPKISGKNCMKLKAPLLRSVTVSVELNLGM